MSDASTTRSLSVAMATLNGERFVEAQLQSIAKQTHLPGELVIVDDGSTDETVAICQRFSDGAPFEVNLEVNSEHLGVAKNFEKAVGATTGDIIFLADQDDVWLPNKIEDTVKYFPVGMAAAVFSDCDIVDSALRPMGYTLWDHLEFTAGAREQFFGDSPFSQLLRHNVVSGLTLAITRSVVDKAFPIPSAWMHDAWLGWVAALEGTLIPLPQSLVLYRQTGSNFIGAKELGMAGKLQIAREGRRANLALRAERMKQLDAYVQTLEGRANLKAETSRKRDHLRSRASLSPNRVLRLIPALQELATLRYHKHSSGMRSFLRDMLVP